MFRRVLKWTVRVLLILIAVASLYVGILVVPFPLFDHFERFGSYRVYSDEPIAADFARVIEEIDRRLAAMEHEPPDASQRVYLCGPGKFAFFSRLLLKNPNTLAIGPNLAAIRADPEYDLGQRVEILLDDGFWSGSGPARRLWEVQILVEFLGEVEGHGLADLVKEEVTETETRQRMLAWHHSRFIRGR